MSEREGLYCEKHVKWCADGVCADCAPAEQRPWSWLINQRAITISGLDAAQRPCDHANGYCKDTAHKYELPVE